jgi:hypothetical protein
MPIPLTHHSITLLTESIARNAMCRSQRNFATPSVFVSCAGEFALNVAACIRGACFGFYRRIFSRVWLCRPAATLSDSLVCIFRLADVGMPCLGVSRDHSGFRSRGRNNSGAPASFRPSCASFANRVIGAYLDGHSSAKLVERAHFDPGIIGLVAHAAAPTSLAASLSLQYNAPTPAATPPYSPLRSACCSLPQPQLPSPQGHQPLPLPQPIAATDLCLTALRAVICHRSLLSIQSAPPSLPPCCLFCTTPPRPRPPPGRPLHCTCCKRPPPHRSLPCDRFVLSPSRSSPQSAATIGFRCKLSLQCAALTPAAASCCCHPSLAALLSLQFNALTPAAASLSPVALSVLQTSAAAPPPPRSPSHAPTSRHVVVAHGG